jgi:hypothetical protein
MSKQPVIELITFGSLIKTNFAQIKLNSIIINNSLLYREKAIRVVCSSQVPNNSSNKSLTKCDPTEAHLTD